MENEHYATAHVQEYCKFKILPTIRATIPVLGWLAYPILSGLLAPPLTFVLLLKTPFYLVSQNKTLHRHSQKFFHKKVFIASKYTYRGKKNRL